MGVRLSLTGALQWQQVNLSCEAGANDEGEMGSERIMADGYRQEVLNVLLAQLLQERGVISAP
jgi:hypothetical protein